EQCMMTAFRCLQVKGGHSPGEGRAVGVALEGWGEVSMLLRRVVLACAFLGIAVTPATPQIVRAPVTVRVMDSSGRPVANARVELAVFSIESGSQELAGAKFSGLADDAGQFIAQLPPPSVPEQSTQPSTAPLGEAQEEAPTPSVWDVVWA